ncbi:hypothetical protein RJZ57_008373 [Blastomyces gilchristii]
MQDRILAAADDGGKWLPRFYKAHGPPVNFIPTTHPASASAGSTTLITVLSHHLPVPAGPSVYAPHIAYAPNCWFLHMDLAPNF